MTNVNEKRYPNISKAVAFRIAFAPMLYTYDDIGWYDYNKDGCSKCGYPIQTGDFLAPKSGIKKEFAILDSYHYGVSINIRDSLIKNFKITENDFRPIRNKRGDIVFYQITPCHKMLPMKSINQTKSLKPCPKCGSVQYREKIYKNKNGWPYSYISKEALDNLHDLNETSEKYEMFIPEWIVSRRGYDFLIEKYPRMSFNPIFLRNKKF